MIYENICIVELERIIVDVELKGKIHSYDKGVLYTISRMYVTKLLPWICVLTPLEAFHATMLAIIMPAL